jgi:hypothetical protein
MYVYILDSILSPELSRHIAKNIRGKPDKRAEVIALHYIQTAAWKLAM